MLLSQQLYKPDFKEGISVLNSQAQRCISRFVIGEYAVDTLILNNLPCHASRKNYPVTLVTGLNTYFLFSKMCFLMASKDSSLMACSSRQASSAAVSALTPRAISILLSTVCRS